MSDYRNTSDKRDTSKGMTPNKSIKRPSNPPVKKPLAVKNTMRRTQGK